MLTVKLRPHHLLCLTFFEGKGYSEEFVQRMKFIISELEKNPIVQLVEGTDQICEACPNNYNTQYQCGDKAVRYDEAVRTFCNLSADSRMEYQILHKIVLEEILYKGKLSMVCSDCEWSSICKNKTF